VLALTRHTLVALGASFHLMLQRCHMGEPSSALYQSVFHRTEPLFSSNRRVRSLFRSCCSTNPLNEKGEFSHKLFTPADRDFFPFRTLVQAAADRAVKKIGIASVGVSRTADPAINMLTSSGIGVTPSEHFIGPPKEQHAGQKKSQIETDEPRERDGNHLELTGLPPDPLVPTSLVPAPQMMITRPQVT